MKKSDAKLPAVLFDLDGTLVDSVYEHVNAWHEELHSAGIRVAKWKIHRRIGMSGKSFVRELLREIHLDKRKVDLEKLERGHDKRFSRTLSGIRALPGGDRLLQHLHRTKVKIAIATSGSRKQTSYLIKKLEIPGDVAVVTGDDVKNAKPAPDIFVAAAKVLEADLSDCIVVGDSVWDLLAAGRKRALGVGLLSGGYGADELAGAGAFRVYEDPEDMLQHLEQLGIPGLP